MRHQSAKTHYKIAQIMEETTAPNLDPMLLRTVSYYAASVEPTPAHLATTTSVLTRARATQRVKNGTTAVIMNASAKMEILENTSVTIGINIH